MGMRRILRMGAGRCDPMRRILRMGRTCTNGVVHNRSAVRGTPMRRILRMGLSCGNRVVRMEWIGCPVRGGAVVGFPLEDVQVPGLAAVGAPPPLHGEVAGVLQLGEVAVDRSRRLPTHIGRQLGAGGPVSRPVAVRVRGQHGPQPDSVGTDRGIPQQRRRRHRERRPATNDQPVRDTISRGRLVLGHELERIVSATSPNRTTRRGQPVASCSS